MPCAEAHPTEDDATGAGRLAAVAVLSYPTVNSAARDRALGMTAWPAARKLALANRDVRTISRVVVHPQFRGVGLASRLVRVICDQCPTRWVEAYAVMGRVHPFFEKGGMTRHDPAGGEGPVYYLFDRVK
jgi:GNAT superfamily N-acetyltransferase